MQAHRLPARNGFLWLLASFRLFRRNPALVISLTMGYLFVVLVLRELPLGPIVLTLALPTLLVILANGFRAVQRGGGLGTIALTFGIASNRWQLLKLGGLLLLGAIAIISVLLLINGEKLSATGNVGQMNQEEAMGMLAQLSLVALPVIAAFWFAPLLVTWDGIPAAKAVFFSFVAVWRNWSAFLSYLITVFIVSAAIPWLLITVAGQISDGLASVLAIMVRIGILLFVWPITTTSVFVSYQDVFRGPPTVD